MSLFTGIRYATFVYFILVFNQDFLDKGERRGQILFCCWFSTIISVFMTIARYSLKKKPTVAFGGGKPDYEVLF